MHLDQIFSKIYKDDMWTNGSGPGSSETYTRGYRAFLQAFLRKKKIRSVVDAGCGDWQFSKLIDWGDISYQGFDVVPGLIEQLNQKKPATNITFNLYNGDPEDLPPADLLILKDVLQHLSFEKIQKFLTILPRYPYALITNSIPVPDWERDIVNSEIEDGGYRPLDLLRPPFRLKARKVYQFNSHKSNWNLQYYLLKCRLLKREVVASKKEVLLVESKRS